MTKDNLIELTLEEKTEQYSFEQAQNELNVAVNQRNLDKALSIAKQIISQCPEFLNIQHMYYQLLLRAQNYQEMVKTALSSISIHPEDAQSYFALANGYRFSYQSKLAKEAMEKACQLQPQNSVWLNMLGIMYKEDGDKGKALDCFNRCIQIAPEFIEPYWQKSALVPNLTDVEIQHLKAIAEPANANPNAKSSEKIVYASYTLFKHYDNKAEFSEAFKYLKLGADTRRASFNYNHQAEIEEHQKIAKVFNEAFICQIDEVDQKKETVSIVSKKLGQASLPPSNSPIFVCGLPRSGTTLVEQIISSHRDVVGGDELFELAKATQNILQQIKPKQPFPFWANELSHENWQAIGEEYLSLTRTINTKKRFTDKMLLNYKAIGLMQLALPDAKIVYCERPAMDLLMGCYKQILGQGNMYTYDLDEMSDMIIAQHQLMKHWRTLFPNKIFTFNYIELVEAQEKTTRALLDFLELDWQEDCLNFYDNKRTIHTISSEQVRQPLNRDSIDKWKNYSEELAPYLDKFNNAGIKI